MNQVEIQVRDIRQLAETFGVSVEEAGRIYREEGRIIREPSREREPSQMARNSEQDRQGGVWY